MMLALVLGLALSVTSLGQYGTTYDIAEPDAMRDIEERAASLNSKQIKADLEKKFKNHRPKDLTALPPALKSYSYPVDVTYTLDYDIPRYDANGKPVGILYPKGYSFNPLDYSPVPPPTMVVFDGDNKKERAWVKKHYKGKPVVFVLSGGDWIKASEDLGVQVFYLKKQIAEKLHLRNTVSIAYQKGRLMWVDVYAMQ